MTKTIPSPKKKGKGRYPKGNRNTARADARRSRSTMLVKSRLANLEAVVLAMQEIYDLPVQLVERTSKTSRAKASEEE